MAANSQIVPAKDTISPKVFWPLVVSVVLTFASTFLAGITPEMLDGLGAFAVPMATALAGVAMTITGYLKSDKLRAIGVEAAAAVLPAAPVTSDVVPENFDAPVETTPVASDEHDSAGELEAEVAQLNTTEAPVVPEPIDPTPMEEDHNRG